MIEIIFSLLLFFPDGTKQEVERKNMASLDSCVAKALPINDVGHVVMGGAEIKAEAACIVVIYE